MTQNNNENEYRDILIKLRDAENEERILLQERQKWNRRLDEVRIKYSSIISRMSDPVSGKSFQIKSPKNDRKPADQDQERKRLVNGLKKATEVSTIADKLAQNLHETDQVLIKCIKENEESIKEKMSAIFDKNGIIENG